MTKAEKKKATAQKKAQAELEKLMCPKCKHSVALHARRDYLYSMYFGGSNQMCQGSIESKDEKGFIRLKACECDLSPKEAYENAKRGVQAAPLDPNALLREL